MPLEDISSRIRSVRDIYSLAAFALVILLVLIKFLVDTFNDTNFEILNTISWALIILTSLIVLVSVICAIMDKYPQIRRDKAYNQTGKIEVVDVDVIQGFSDIKCFKETWLRDQDSAIISGEHPLIDIKVRNPSDRVAFLKEIIFDAHCVEKLPSPELPYPNIKACVIPSKWDYNILFDPSKDTDTLRLKISQEVPSNGVDRFVIIVGQTIQSLKFTSITYEVGMTLYYNNNESIIIDTIKISIPTIHPFNILNPITTIHHAQGK